MFRRSRFLLALAAGAALSFVSRGATPPAPVIHVPKRARDHYDAAPQISSSLTVRSSLRIGVAQAKRIAAKRRNQRRHKRHLRR